MATTLTPFAARLLADVAAFPQQKALEISQAAGSTHEEAIVVLHLPGSPAHIAKSTGIEAKVVRSIRTASIAWHAGHSN